MIEGTRSGSRLVVYRFDVSVAEAYDGIANHDAAEAGKLLKPLTKHTANAKGTNVAVVLRAVEKGLDRWPLPVEVNIFTDCGTELMSQEDKAYVREVSERWRQSGKAKVVLHGVRTGHREELRDMMPSCTIAEY